MNLNQLSTTVGIRLSGDANGEYAVTGVPRGLDSALTRFSRTSTSRVYSRMNVIVVVRAASRTPTVSKATPILTMFAAQLSVEHIRRCLS
jgi:hypothetical protein